MKNLLVILLVLSLPAFGQQQEVMSASKKFHEMLLKPDNALAGMLDKSLSYGHSNGWVESKDEMLENLASGKMKYIAIQEDSLQTTGNDNLVNLRFKATITARLNGNEITVDLKILEVWLKKDEKWQLFARQAVRIN